MHFRFNSANGASEFAHGRIRRDEQVVFLPAARDHRGREFTCGSRTSRPFPGLDCGGIACLMTVLYNYPGFEASASCWRTAIATAVPPPAAAASRLDGVGVA